MSTKNITALIIILALGIGGWIFFGGEKQNIPETFQYAEGVPCHSMGNFYMGECEFDKDGNPTNL